MRRYVLPLALIVLVGLGLWWFARLRLNPAHAPLPTPSAEDAVPALDANALEANGEHAREETHSAVVPTEPGREPDSPKQSTATIRARFLDPLGKAVARVALIESRGEGETLGQSDAEGRIDAPVRVWATEGSRVRLEARHPEFVMREFDRVVHPSELLDLGDVKLERGGSVSGRVVDSRGRPAAKVGVVVAPAANNNGPERMSDGPYNATNSGTTDERGQFRFAGVPAGDTRVWAFRERPPWSSTEPFEVREGEEMRGLELVLQDLSPDAPRGMRFLARTPDGAPAPGVWFVYRARNAEGMSMGGLIADADGVAELDASQIKQLLGGKIDIDASDTKDRWGGVALLDVPIVAGDREVRMTQSRLHQLVVNSADGTQLADFSWRMLDQARYTRPEWTRTRAEPARGLRSLDYFEGNVLVGHGDDVPRNRQTLSDRLVRFASGYLPFVVQAEAPGFQRAEVGPFTPATAPGVITITLDPLPAIRGIVVHAKQPVAGASVQLSRSVATLINGFQSRVEPQPVAHTQSDAQGRFLLPFREGGSYIVQAQTIELGLGESGPVSVALEGSTPDVLVEITDPGRIEGHLLLPPDSAGDDWIVGASRGDGKAYSCRASHEGAFHFEKLAPGRWLLHSLEREIAAGEMHWSSSPEPSPLDRPWPYEVRSGETTTVEIDLRQEAELTGTLSIPGWAGKGWNAMLEAEGSTFGGGARALDVADGGEFHLKVRPPGAYRLVLSEQRQEGTGWRVEMESLTLVAGTQTWAFANSVGTVVFVNRRETPSAFEVLNELAPGRSSKITFTVPAKSELEIGGLFAGISRLVRYEDMQPSDAGSVTVQPGTTIRFERP